ncbi:hypothetical protein K3177_15075 [Qipengyuania sp. GH25]|uniref:histidine kinase n=1 Tax=Qipengyuania pacifica TaxID=2860199 RepID=A0ABS7JKA3_9SPHN|nr:PAS domain-containing sensor histidine kinase [Qipengyuania aerophila]MBX7489829.1 hypothetical protein [Qipengyuania aerophila]
MAIETLPCLLIHEASGFDSATITFASPSAISILGANSLNDLCGRELSSLVASDDTLVNVLHAGLNDIVHIASAPMITISGVKFKADLRAIRSSASVICLAWTVADGAEALREELEAARHQARKSFDELPAALWKIDGKFSFHLFRALKQQGVTDIDAYFEAHPEIVEQAMRESVVADVNALTAQKFGRGNPEELRIPVEYFWDGNSQAFRRLLVAKFQGAEEFVEEIRMRTLDGEFRDVLFTMTFPPDTQPDRYTYISMIDITDRVHAEEHLRRIESEFAHSSRLALLGELTASIAHEINQPLSAMATNGDAAMRWLDRDEPDTCQAKNRVSRIVEDARRASEVVHRVRSLARPQMRQHCEFGINDVVREAVRLVRHQSLKHRVSIALSLSPDLPPVLGDPIQLQQVVANLIVNSSQAIASVPVPRARRIIVETALIDDGHIALNVTDTGPGISESSINHIFDGFFTTKDEGMGMGLAISRTIVMAHKGTIEGKNSPEGGAVFELRLPISN